MPVSRTKNVHLAAPPQTCLPALPRSEFPSNTFYEGALQNGITVAERSRPQVPPFHNRTLAEQRQQQPARRAQA